MANTRVSDIVVPEVYSKYLIEESIKKTSFYRSGVLALHSLINEKIAGGGETFNMPFWQDLSGDVQAIQSNGTLTTQKATTSKMVARRLLFGQGWSAEELASALAGDNAMDAIASMVDKYWEAQLQAVLFSTVKGVIADNQDNDSGDLVNNITTTGTPGDSNKISATAVIDSLALLGDAGNDFQALAMHSTPYWKLVKNNLIAYVPDAEEKTEIPTFMGKRVIVTDQLGADTDGANSVYWTIVFKPGAIGWGESGNNITVVETDRVAAKGEDYLYTRRQFVMHPLGYKWIDNSVAAEMPTKSEIEEAGNWDRVFNRQNCGFAVLKSNG